jgi:hypothetical protein
VQLEVRGELHVAPRVAGCKLEIHDEAVGGIPRIRFQVNDSLDHLVGAGRADFRGVGHDLAAGDVDPCDLGDSRRGEEEDGNRRQDEGGCRVLSKSKDGACQGSLLEHGCWLQLGGMGQNASGSGKPGGENALRLLDVNAGGEV